MYDSCSSQRGNPNSFQSGRSLNGTRYQLGLHHVSTMVKFQGFLLSIALLLLAGTFTEPDLVGVAATGPGNVRPLAILFHLCDTTRSSFPYKKTHTNRHKRYHMSRRHLRGLAQMEPRFQDCAECLTKPTTTPSTKSACCTGLVRKRRSGDWSNASVFFWSCMNDNRFNHSCHPTADQRRVLSLGSQSDP